MAQNLGFTNFQDPFSYGEGLDDIYKQDNSAFGTDSVGGALSRIFDPKGFQIWQDYQNKMYERQSINSARAWDLWFDSTATQRRVDDLKKAGLNPWLAVSNNGGGLRSFSESSASSGGLAKANNQNDNKAAYALALAKLISVLLI